MRGSPPGVDAAKSHAHIGMVRRFGEGAEEREKILCLCVLNCNVIVSTEEEGGRRVNGIYPFHGTTTKIYHAVSGIFMFSSMSDISLSLSEKTRTRKALLGIPQNWASHLCYCFCIGDRPHYL